MTKGALEACQSCFETQINFDFRVLFCLQLYLLKYQIDVGTSRPSCPCYSRSLLCWLRSAVQRTPACNLKTKTNNF